MANITNYTTLVQNIQALCEDDSAEFLSYIPTAIDMAEKRMFRLLDYDYSKESSGILTTLNQDTITKPLDHRVTHNVFITVNNERIRLIKKTEEYLKDYWPSTVETGIPKYYADKDALTWLVKPTPNAAYNVLVEYEYVPIGLSPSNQSNIYITHFPDMLFYASLVGCAEWLKDDEMFAKWESKFQEALASSSNEGRRLRMDDNTHVNNPEGGRNTKVKNGV